MDFFSNLRKAFNDGRKKAHDEAESRRNRNNRKVAKLIEPNYGRIVTLEVITEEPVLHMTMDMFKSMADGENLKVEISGNKATFTFSDATLAEAFRSGWRD